jgi:hypothetical protein
VDLIDILLATGATEPSTFNEFCRGLRDCPERGDREGWADLFKTIGSAERLGLVEVERLNGKIETLILTEAGAAKARAAEGS